MNNTGKKHGGRIKGTPNKLTKEMRVLLKGIVFNELETIQDKLDKLDDKERLETLIKLLPYVLPKAMHLTSDSKESDLPVQVYKLNDNTTIKFGA